MTYDTDTVAGIIMCRAQVRGVNKIARGSLPLGAQHVDDALEGEPLRDLLARAEHSAELGARQLLDLEVLARVQARRV